jgi:hypothetical protein
MTILICCPLVNCKVASGAGSAPRLLPPAEDLHLTLTENPQSDLPLGPSCDGEASRTLMCRAFTVTFENASSHTIHISGLRCEEPWIRFERELPPNSGSIWWPISQPEQPRCETLDWTNTRLRPGERTEYQTRLVSARRSIESVGPGLYTIRANWTLFGCTEMPEGTDCLTPLQDTRLPGSAAAIGYQEPVTVYSNELVVESPNLGDLGILSFAFDVTVLPPGSSNVPSNGNNSMCSEEIRTSIDCTAFHYVIRNLTDRPVRNATMSCSDSGIQAEYRLESSEWRPVPNKDWSCTMNVLIETKILPGGTVEGTFTLGTLRPGLDTSSLRALGAYQFRFTFWPSSCFASPDASFCLVRPEKQPHVRSKDLTVDIINGAPLQDKP